MAWVWVRDYVCVCDHSAYPYMRNSLAATVLKADLFLYLARPSDSILLSQKKRTHFIKEDRHSKTQNAQSELCRNMPLRLGSVRISSSALFSASFPSVAARPTILINSRHGRSNRKMITFRYIQPPKPGKALQALSGTVTVNI